MSAYEALDFVARTLGRRPTPHPGLSTFGPGSPFDRRARHRTPELKADLWASASHLHLGIARECPFRFDLGPTRYGEAPSGAALVWLAEQEPRVAVLLQNDALLQVWRNQTALTFAPAGQNDAWERFDSLVAFVAALPPAEPEPSPSTSLPPEFADLGPLADRWAEGDDGVRGEALARASTVTLRKLAGTVVPRLGAIDAYLDAPHDPDADPVLTAIAEAALEAQLIVERRATQ